MAALTGKMGGNAGSENPIVDPPAELYEFLLLFIYECNNLHLFNKFIMCFNFSVNTAVTTGSLLIYATIIASTVKVKLTHGNVT